MGCGSSASKQSGSSAGKALGILVHSAKGLRGADWLAGGNQSDPFVVCRVGPTGSAWDAKPKDSETQSHTEWFTTSPVWHHAFTWALPKGEKEDAFELHLKVYDRDLLSFNDPLGEVRIPLATLAASQNSAKDYPLPTQGSVSVLMGDRVEKALVEELSRTMQESDSAGWFYPVQQAVHKIARYLKAQVGFQHYYLNMGQIFGAWGTPLKKGADPLDFFHKRMRDGAGTNTYQWVGPEIQDCLTLFGHADITQQLSTVHERLGTSNTNGQVYKPNYLGFLHLTTKLWPEVPWHAMGLNAPQETHAAIRPLLVKLLTEPGVFWTKEMLAEDARAFFAGRDSFEVNQDLRVWCTRILHRTMVGLHLSEAEGAEFMDMQGKILPIAGAPEQALEMAKVQEALSFKEVAANKAKWIERYKVLLQKHLPEDTKNMSADELTYFASGVMDGLVFAGGQSVPSVLQWAISMPFSEWGKETLPPGFSLSDTSVHPAYLWEIIRFFAPVKVCALSERAYGTSAAERHVMLQIQMGARDQRVWGADASQFKLRPLEEYHSKSIAFAEPASLPTMASPNARSCPAKGLAYEMSLAFLKEFAHVTAQALGTVEKVWRPQALAKGKDGLIKDLTPADITLHLLGTSAYRLTKAK